MWFLLVTTVATAVFTDAAYLYNTPNVPFNLLSNQPANIYNIQNFLPQNTKVGQDIKDEDKSISYSISHKDYAYLKKDNVENNVPNGQWNQNYNNLQTQGNNGQSFVPQNLQNSGLANVNHGYSGYSLPTTSFQNNNAQSYAFPIGNIQTHQQATPLLTNNNLNAGYVQSNPLYYSNSFSNSYAQKLSSLNQNIGYTQTLTSTNNNNLNDYSYKTVTAPVGTQNGYSQSFIPTGGQQLNNGFVHSSNTKNQVAQTSESLNGGYNYGQTAQAVVAFNNPYSQVSQTSDSINNGYRQGAQTSANSQVVQDQTSSAGVNLNSGYAHRLPFSPTFNEVASPSTGNSNINSGYTQSYAQSVSNSNVNLGYKQATSSGANINTAFTPNHPPVDSGSSSNGYSQISTGPTHIDLNLATSQPSTSSAFSTLTASSNTLNNALVQTNFNMADNPRPGNAFSSSPIKPTIQKHIYFHAPPPELEESQKVAASTSPPRKNYKIIFIKLPSQKSVPLQKTAIEEKTLIYVLVKKPEIPEPVELPKPKPSEHKVYFVKYNGSPFDIASQVNEDGTLGTTGSIKSIVPLQPGLVNGGHK